jgi:flagellar motor switch/type III secretory pathway protein FliN
MISLEQVNRYAELPFTVEAELGRLMLPMREVLALGPGSVLRLPVRSGAAVGLLAGDISFASGEVVRIGNAPAVRLKAFAAKKSE